MDMVIAQVVVFMNLVHMVLCKVKFYEDGSYGYGASYGSRYGSVHGFYGSSFGPRHGSSYGLGYAGFTVQVLVQVAVTDMVQV